MNKRDWSRLDDMREYAADAISFLADANADALAGDKKTRFALIRALEIVGEAASKISPETRSALPHIPWSRIVATRNVLIHGYTGFDLDAVVKVVREDLPTLLAQLGDILKDPPE